MNELRPFSGEVIPPQIAAVSIAVLCGARSVKEVADACGWKSKSTAHGYLKAAQALGFIVWDHPEHDRAILPGLGLVASSFGRNGFLGGRAL